MKETKKKEKNIKEKVKTKKCLKLKKSIKFTILIFLILLILVAVTIILYQKFIMKENSNLNDSNKQELIIDYDKYFFFNVKVLKDKTLYKLENDELIKIGTVYKDTSLNLESDELKEKGYFKLKDFAYYIDYQDLEETTNLSSSNETYLNYIPYNLNAKTTLKTNFYQDNSLIFTLDEEVSLPIIIKEEEYYGVLYNEKLLYLKKDEVEVIENKNTDLKSTDGIAALVYHFVYDSTNLEEEKNCKNSNITICLSDTLFREHMTYIKDNNFYTATMQDLELFVDGKIRLPEKTVVITIDDGSFVSASIKILEELDLHATLFLIGSVSEPSNYESPNLEIHSHTYALHYPGACAGGQGSPLKCLDKETLLADLKKSREQLNGSTVFCYPFFEYNDYAIEVLKEAGFTMAFAGGRTKIRVGSNKYKLPRYGVINTTFVSDIKNIIN